MRRWLKWIGITVGVLALMGAALVASVYFYDRSGRDRLANGIVVAGIPVGGMRIDDARALLHRRLVPPLERPFVLAYRRHTFVVRPKRNGLTVDVDGMLQQAVTATRGGGIVHRFWRDVRGRGVGLSVPLAAAYSKPSVDRFVDRLARRLYRPPHSASVTATARSLAVKPSRPGLALEKRVLAREIERRILDLDAPRALPVPVRIVRPRVTTADLPRKYPAFILVDRGSYKLRLFRGLKLYKVYPIAVGRAGLETPAGLYHIDDKQVNPSWHVPDSPWAGELAGRVIPPGPDDPIKARWMGFYNGAGIHGTEDIGSIGTSASHGCIRMLIPDVEELYNLVPYGTPIYVG